MNSALLAYKLRKFAAETAVKKDPEKWEQAKRDAVASMGGKHSARAMQQAVKLYKERGGEYKGSKPSASQNSMAKWTKQDWQTRPGTPEKAERKDGSTARYLPKEKWDSLSKKERVATDRKKLRSDEQYVANTRAAKVKGDAAYYDKKASLHRLKTALHKQAVLEIILPVFNPGTRAVAGLFGRKAIGAGKGLASGLAIRAPGVAENLDLARLSASGGPEAVAIKALTGALLPTASDALKTLGSRFRPAGAASGVLDESLEFNSWLNNPRNTVLKKTMLPFLQGIF